MTKPKITLGTINGSFPLWRNRLALDKRFIASHKHVMGKAGMGKSKLLEAYYLQCIRYGSGCSFLDPHGTSGESILRQLVASDFFKTPGAFEKLKYFEFSDEGPYVPFNVLQQRETSAYVLAADILDTMHRAWPALAQGSAPQFDTVILSASKILIDNGLCLPALQKLLTDREYRNSLLTNVSDYGVLSYWQDHFDRLSLRDQADQVQSALRRIFLLTFAPVLEYSLGQADNYLDFSQFMNNSQFVIYNTANIHDEEAKVLLECFITKGYERAALARKNPGSLPIHTLIIDEFASVSPKSEEALGTMLSQTRKFGLFSFLSHQSWGQLGRDLQGALQNVQVDVSFQLGVDDADIMAKWFANIEPTAVKESEASARSLASFVGPSEQRDLFKGYLTELPPRHALVKIAGRKAVEIVTVTVPESRVDEGEVAEIKKEYERRLMKHKSEIVLPHHQPFSQRSTHR